MVYAVNQEVLSGTDAVVISCQVTGLTVALGTVKWTDSNGNDVTTLATKSSYTVNDGTLQGNKPQTTTLTVASAQTSSDATYSCLVTPGSPDDTTEVSKSVTLKVYSKSNVFLFKSIFILNFNGSINLSRTNNNIISMKCRSLIIMLVKGYRDTRLQHYIKEIMVL